MSLSKRGAIGHVTNLQMMSMIVLSVLIVVMDRWNDSINYSPLTKNKLVMGDVLDSSISIQLQTEYALVSQAG